MVSTCHLSWGIIFITTYACENGPNYPWLERGCRKYQNIMLMKSLPAFVMRFNPHVLWCLFSCHVSSTLIHTRCSCPICCPGMFGSLQRLLTNRVFLLVNLNQVFFWFAFFGYITFKAKFLEHQFKISAAKANQYIGGQYDLLLLLHIQLRLSLYTFVYWLHNELYRNNFHR